MPESKPISVRIPQNLLEQVDAIALLHYPPRKRGAAPNRSQMILDFITQGVEQTRHTAYDNGEKSKGQDVTYDSSDSRQTTYDSTDNRQLISVYDRVIIEEVVQQQLSQLGIANEIALLHQEITELKNLVADRPEQSQPLVTVDSPNTVSDNSSTISDDRERPERQDQPTTASTQPQSATQRQSDRSGPEQSQPATASKQPEPAIQRQPEPLIDDRHRLSDNCEVISDSGLDPNVSTPGKQPPLDSLVLTDRDRFSPAADESDRTPPEQPYPASAETQAQQEFQPQSVAPQRSDRDCLSPTDESDRTPPEQPDLASAEIQAQSALQPESAAPEQSERDRPSPTTESDRIPPEQLDSATASTQAQSVLQPESAAPPQSNCDRPLPIDESDRIPPEQPNSTTASTQAQSVLQPESAAPPQSNCDRADTVLQPAPEQPHSVTASTQAQSVLQPQSTAPAQSDRKRADTVLQPVYDPYTPPPETASVSVIAEPKQPMPQPGETYEPGGSGITKNFVKPGENQKPPYGNRIVEISTSDDLLAEIRWCLNNDGNFVFLFEPRNGTPRRAYYLRHERYWEGMRPVKTALVRELIDRRAIWTNDPAKGPGSGCRQFYPTASTPTLERSASLASEFPEWMTARQAFQALGGDPGDRNSSVSSSDGLKQIKFSTFKSKTSSELKPFGLELSQERKRRRQPCYRFLKIL